MRYLTYANAKKAILKQLELILDNYSMFDAMQVEFIVASSVERLMRSPEYKNDPDSEILSKLNEDLSYFQPDPELRKESKLFIDDTQLYNVLTYFYERMLDKERKVPIR